MTEYSNPRMNADFDAWPSGKNRVRCSFHIERNARGERAVRTTTGAPKRLTFADCVRIVDGDDGRTYLMEHSLAYRHITIMKGDMKYQHEVIFERDPRYAKYVAMLQAAE